MQYFKPAAGIIILIFVLALLYEGATTEMEESKRQEAVQSQRVTESLRQDDYDACVQKAEDDKEKTASVGRTELTLQKTSGRFDVMVSNCISSNPASRMEYYNNNESARLMLRNTCEAAATESIMRSHRAMPEEIEEQYQSDLRSCGVKYGQ